MPHRLLKSIIAFNDELSQDELVKNFQHLRVVIEAEQFEWSDGADERLYKQVLAHFVQYFEVPSAQTLYDYFRELESGGTEEFERMKDIAVAPVYTGTNFRKLLRSQTETQAIEKIKAEMNKSLQIMKKENFEDGLLYITQAAQALRLVDNSSQVSGDIREDGDIMREEYELAEKDKGNVIGTLLGVKEIDEACRGLKKGELWIHAGFPGELKSTLAVNWAYNAATRYRKNVVYISFEMTRAQIRRQLYTLHSSNPKFTHEGLGPLDYGKIRDGELTASEKEFYFERVIKDLEGNDDYMHIEVITPDRDWTMDDIQAQLELLHKEFEIGLVIFDHGQWINAKKSNKNRDYTIELNSIVRDSKRLALQFNKNAGLPILMLFQINRNGKNEADKNEGVYKLNALNYSNECCAKGTLIQTKNGLKPIEQVSVGEFVWSSTGWKSILDWYDNGTRQVLEVRTDRGVVMKTTADHLYRTLEDGELTWTPAQDLLGKHVLGARGGVSDRPPPKLPELEFGPWERKARQGSDIKVPKEVTPELAYLLGAHAGDGILNGSDVGFCGNIDETAMVERLSSYFREVFGQELSYRESNDSNAFYLCMGSAALDRWFRAIGSDRQAGVPSCILRAPEDCQRAFIRGFWDTDGHVNTQGIVVISQKRSKRQTLEEVQLMLASMGIDSTLGGKTVKLRGKKHPQAVLRVRSRVSRARFLNLIGFTEPHKQNKLSAHVSEMEESYKASDREEWPVRSLCQRLIAKYCWVSREKARQEEAYSKLLNSEIRQFSLKQLTLLLFGFYSGAECRKTYSVVQGLVRRGHVSKLGLGLYQFNGTNPRIRLSRKCSQLRTREFATRASLEEFVDALETLGIEDEDLALLKRLLDTCISQKVVSVELSGEERVYDLEVTGDHEYATGGLYTHNCEKTADVITTTYLNDDLRRQGYTKITNLKNRDNPLFPPFEAHINFPCRRLSSANKVESGRPITSEDHDQFLEEYGIGDLL